MEEEARGSGGVVRVQGTRRMPKRGGGQDVSRVSLSRDIRGDEEEEDVDVRPIITTTT